MNELEKENKELRKENKELRILLIEIINFLSEAKANVNAPMMTTLEKKKIEDEVNKIFRQVELKVGLMISKKLLELRMGKGE